MNEDLTEANRFSVLYNLPHCERHFMETKRTQHIEISRKGILLGSKLRIFKRGKEIDVKYFITEAGIEASNP